MTMVKLMANAKMADGADERATAAALRRCCQCLRANGGSAPRSADQAAWWRDSAKAFDRADVDQDWEGWGAAASPL